MSQLLSDNLLAGGYLLAWVLTFAWYHRQSHRIDGGSVVMACYILYAVFSIVTINDPLFSMAFKPLRLFPYIFLYVVQMLALMPIIYFHQEQPKQIADPNTRIIGALAVFIICCSVMLIPDLCSSTNTGLLNMFSDASTGKDAYMEQIEAAADSGSVIRNIPAIFYNMFSDIAVFLCFYLLTQKRRKWMIAGMIFSVIMGILMPITRGQRGGVITGLLTAIGGYMLFRPYLSKSVKKITKYFGIACLTAFMFPVIAITLSRFGKEAGGVGGFVNWYIGQGSLYFNNYGLDAGGTRHGDRTLNYFKQIVSKDVPKNFVERRDKYHNLNLDDNFFSTFVGDFCIDFGPVATVIIFILFAWLITHYTREREGEIPVYKLLLIFFTLCISLQGGMTLFSYSDSGNLRIAVLVLFYTYLRYHEVLLRRFPLVHSEQVSVIEDKPMPDDNEDSPKTPQL